MTKISFDVDFNQDPDKILQEIQQRAEAEVAKREAKDKEKNYLSKLHEVVNKEIGSEFKNINALIRALTKYASPSVRDKIENTSNFVNCIHFYPSNRIDGTHNKKDLAAISYLTKDQLDDFNYSDTYARFVVEDLMKQKKNKRRNLLYQEALSLANNILQIQRETQTRL